jgi:hypothetical protein
VLGALAGLTSMAFAADSRSLSGGTRLIVQPTYPTAVPYIYADWWIDGMPAPSTRHE